MHDHWNLYVVNYTVFQLKIYGHQLKLAYFRSYHMEIFKILSAYPFDVYNGIQQTFWTICIFESALLQKYRNKNIWTAIIRCIGFYFENMQMYMKKQTSQMRLFVLDTVYVWRYKYKKDIHHRHLISKDCFELKFILYASWKIMRFNQVYKLIDHFTHFGHVSCGKFSQNFPSIMRSPSYPFMESCLVPEK